MDNNNRNIEQGRVPWSATPSLKELSDDVGLDFDRLIKGFEQNKDDLAMAQEFGVSEKLIRHLRNHFAKRGIQSIIGQD